MYLLFSFPWVLLLFWFCADTDGALEQMGSCARFRVVTFASPSLEESVAGLKTGELEVDG